MYVQYIPINIIIECDKKELQVYSYYFNEQNIDDIIQKNR